MLVRVASAGLALDVTLVAGMFWIYAFDTESVLFILLFLLPAEAAIFFGLAGALWVWAASTVLYVGRELYAQARYDAEFNLVSINFRMGVLLLVSIIVGLFARNLQRRSTELRAALEELQAEASWREAMIDMLAHDLRSPVGAAVSSMSLLHARLTELDPAAAKQLAGNAIRQNRRALRLADDLLDLARARAGKLELNRQRIDVAVALDQLVADLNAESWAHIIIDADLRADVDPGRFEQIATNLIINAHRHGRPPVRIEASDGPKGGVTLRVTDNGEGIPADRQHQLFEAFTCGPRADSVGLGLWISHTLAVAHGGSLAYDESSGAPSFVAVLPGTSSDPDGRL